jgi:hypothetical protein
MKCEKCKKEEDVIYNPHPKASFHLLCKNCIKQFLKQGSADRIMFERLLK